MLACPSARLLPPVLGYLFSFFIIYCCCCCCLLFGGAEASIEHGIWNYADKGPSTWAKISPQFCAGRKQSPVDLVPARSEFDPDLTGYTMRVEEAPEYSMTLGNDGHKLVITLGANMSIKKGLGDTMFYTAEQLHWHWGANNSRGSEHTVDGRAFPMEGHLVFWNSLDYANFSVAVHRVGGLAVLGVLYELSDTDNPLLLALEKYMPQLVNAYTEVNVTFKADQLNFLDAFLPKSTSHFYRYEGGLTTPTCNENVLWTVYTATVPISQRQLDMFRALHDPYGRPNVDNFRPVQPLNPTGRPGAKRVVYQTFNRGRGKASDAGGKWLQLDKASPAVAAPASAAAVAAAAALLGCLVARSAGLVF